MPLLVEVVDQYQKAKGDSALTHLRKVVAHHPEVVLASLDDEPGVRPREHIFVGSRACWHEITDALPQFVQWPPGLERVTA